jgi:hypothetical protein
MAWALIYVHPCMFLPVDLCAGAAREATKAKAPSLTGKHLEAAASAPEGNASWCQPFLPEAAASSSSSSSSYGDASASSSSLPMAAPRSVFSLRGFLILPSGAAVHAYNHTVMSVFQITVFFKRGCICVWFVFFLAAVTLVFQEAGPGR